MPVEVSRLTDDQAWLVRQAITQLGVRYQQKQASLLKEYEAERKRLESILTSRIIPRTTT